MAGPQWFFRKGTRPSESNFNPGKPWPPENTKQGNAEHQGVHLGNLPVSHLTQDKKGAPIFKTPSDIRNKLTKLGVNRSLTRCLISSAITHSNIFPLSLTKQFLISPARIPLSLTKQWWDFFLFLLCEPAIEGGARFIVPKLTKDQNWS